MYTLAMSTVVGIFAHPDDETFGPGGTLAVMAKKHDVYIICATNGDGKLGNRKKEIALGKTRKKELLASAEILGIKKVFFLGHRDGSLSHNLYHTLAQEVLVILRKLKPEILITFEPRGVSGHIDHIVMSMVTSFVFPELKSVKKLMKYCLPIENSMLMGKDYFIHFPLGYTEEEIDEVVSTAAVWEQKVAAMHKHVTQMHDVDKILTRTKHLPKQENFLVIEKEM
jgi:LmbE family N-acetylglucosaminyl deacetylase